MCMCVYMTVYHIYRLRIGVFKILKKVISYDINSPFHDKKLYIIYYKYKVREVKFYKFINKNKFMLLTRMMKS
jgi:hypothetical protein